MAPERQWRVQFDAEVTFRNGGGLSVQGFRLDAPGPDVSDRETGEMLVRDLALLMVDEVRIKAKTMIEEPHKGSRRDEVTEVAERSGDRRVHTLSTPGSTAFVLPTPAGDDRLTGLVDLDGVLVRTTGSTRDEVDRAALLAGDVTGRAVLLHTGLGSDGGPALTEDAAQWLVAQGAVLVGLDSAPLRVLGTPAAVVLAEASIPLVAGLTGLDMVPSRGFRLHLVPDGLRSGTVYVLTPGD